MSRIESQLGSTTFARLGLAFILLMALWASGCAYQSHMRQGDDQYEQGNYEAALESYEKARELKPESQDAAERLKQTKKALVGRWRLEAEKSLRKGDWVGAVEAAAEALSVAPENDATRVLVQDVGFKAREEAKKRAGQGNYAASLSLYQAILQGLTTERVKTEPEARLVRQKWATVVRSRAREAESDSLHGLALLNWVKAANLQPNAGYESKAAGVYARVLESARYHVCLSRKQRDVGYRAVAASLEQLRLPDGLALSTSKPSDECDAELVFDVGRPDFDRSQSTHTEVVEYQSGTREVPNSAYERRERELNREKRELLDAEEEVDYQREQVDKYRSQVAQEGPTPNTSTGAEQNLSRAESRLESARRDLESQRRRVQRAYDELDRTDRFTEEPVYQELAYTVTTHRIEGSLRLTGELRGAETVALEQDLGVSAADQQHPAQKPANIAEDPLTLPPENELGSQLYARAASYTAKVLEDQFEDYRERLLEHESSASAREQVDALVRYLVLDPRQFSEQAVRDIEELTGIPEADALVRHAAELPSN
ncbi:MAG: tetratricopeptide repeat protein [Myxococcota bacterium]